MSDGISAPPRIRSAHTEAMAALRRHPVTATVAAITVAVSIPALALPGLVRALEQVPQALWRGQWWRLVSPMFVQGYGLRQFAFNLLGIVVAGAAVEQRYGRGRWLVVYLTAGIAGIMLTSWWFPHQTDSGSSAAVAGLIGALAVHLVATRASLPTPALLYSAFFAVYLTGEGFHDPVTALVAGLASMAAVVALRARPVVLSMVTAGVTIVAMVAMLAIGDVHGVGLATGMVVAILLRPPRTLFAAWAASLPERPAGPEGGRAG